MLSGVAIGVHVRRLHFAVHSDVGTMLTQQYMSVTNQHFRWLVLPDLLAHRRLQNLHGAAER